MNNTRGNKNRMNTEVPARAAEIVREYGPFGDDNIGGVSHDGRRVWAAAGSRLIAIDPDSGEIDRTLERAAHAGTAFDGTHLYQIAEARIDKIDPVTGTWNAIPRRAQGHPDCWAEGECGRAYRNARSTNRSRNGAVNDTSNEKLRTACVGDASVARQWEATTAIA